MNEVNPEVEVGRLLYRLVTGSLSLTDGSVLIQKQLDTLKQNSHKSGMIEAAEICEKQKHRPGVMNMSPLSICADSIKAEILTAANNKKL